MCDNKYIITHPADKRNIMGTVFESINAPRPLNKGTRLVELVNRYVDKFKKEFEKQKKNNDQLTDFTNSNPAHLPDNQTIENYFCTFHEVAAILKNLPIKTSSGIDNIPQIVLKHLPNNLIKDLTVIFNNALNNRYFPRIWKKAKVLPIQKPGKNPEEIDSYRPISLNSNISKVFEAVLQKSIYSNCEKNNIILNNQYGFKYKHSICHAIAKFLTDANNHITDNKIVAAALIDLEKAFDSVWINGLIFKLIKYKFPRHLIQSIWSMVNGKSFVIWDGNETTEKIFHIKDGLQQGTITSPILFNIFNADILNMYEMNSDKDTHSIAFADDLIVYIAGKKTIDINKKLNTLVNNINSTYQIWNQRLNPEKCETIILSKTIVSCSH